MRQDRRLTELSLDMENPTGVGMARGGLGPMMFTEYQVIDLHSGQYIHRFVLSLKYIKRSSNATKTKQRSFNVSLAVLTA